MASWSSPEKLTDASVANGVGFVNGVLLSQAIELSTSFRGRRTPPSYVPISLFSRQTTASCSLVVLVVRLEAGTNAGVEADKEEGMIDDEERSLLRFGMEM